MADSQGLTRNVLRLLMERHVQVARFKGQDDDFILPDTPITDLVERLREQVPRGWSLTPDQRRRLAGEVPFAGYLDLVLWAEAWVRQKLDRAYAHEAARWSPIARAQEPFLRAALLGSLLNGCLPGQSLRPTLRELWNRSRDEVTVLAPGWSQVLEGYCESEDHRTLIVDTVPAVFREPPHLLMDRLGLSLPRGPARIDPAWVLKYQRRTRVANQWFYSSQRGPGMFLVLHSRRCRYGRCLGCNLWKLGMDQSPASVELCEQVRHAIVDNLADVEASAIREVVLSNNGSVLDPETMPGISLEYSAELLAMRLTNLACIVCETRAEFITEATLKRIRTTLDSVRPGIRLEVALGIEVFDETLRNRHYRKNLTNRILEGALAACAAGGASFRGYFMYRPLPGMTPSEAEADLRRGVELLEAAASHHALEVTLHLNPTFVAVGSELEQEFQLGRFEPVTLDELEMALARLGKTRIRVHVGLSDEGLAVPGGSFLRPGCEPSLERLRKYNLVQDPSVLGTV